MSLIVTDSVIECIAHHLEAIGYDLGRPIDVPDIKSILKHIDEVRKLLIIPEFFDGSTCIEEDYR